MKLLLDTQRIRLIANGRFNACRRADGEDEFDFAPVVKLFCPWGAATWLLSELDPDDPDIAFGLCDLGMKCPELGSVCLTELEGVTGPVGLRIERDRHFKADKTLQAYADEATVLRHIRA